MPPPPPPHRPQIHGPRWSLALALAAMVGLGAGPGWAADMGAWSPPRDSNGDFTIPRGPAPSPSANSRSLPPPGGAALATADDPCPVGGTVAVDFTVAVAPVALRRTRSYAELSRSQGAEDWRVMGLTSDTAGADGEVEWAWAMAGRGAQARACVWAVAVHAAWTRRGRTIDLAAEIPEGGCLDHEILAHERRHAALSEQLTAKWAAAAERAVRAEAARLIPIRFTPGNDPQGGGRAIAEAMNARIRQAMNPAFNRLRFEEAAEQSLIDTPSEYARLSAVCGGEGPRLLRRHGN